MGVNYYQYGIVGFTTTQGDCKKVISPAQYKEEDRYDTKTGNKTHTENILVKHEESIYKLEGEEFTDFWDILDSNNFDTIYDNQGDVLFVGKALYTEDYGKVNLLEGSYSLQDLKNMFEEVQEQFPNRIIGLHFTNHIG